MEKYKIDQTVELTKEQFEQCSKERTRFLFFRRSEKNRYFVKPVNKTASIFLENLIG